MYRIITVFCLLSFVCSCHSKQKALTEESKKVTQTGSPQEQKEKIYRFTVSFISIGSGTDSRLREKYDGYISSFEQQHKVQLKINKAPWGREGEMDYCFEFNNLSDDLTQTFITDSRKILGESRLINIGENTHCRGVIRN